MAAIDDAKASLQTAITNSRTFLANRDEPANLATAFGPLVQIRNSLDQWVRALICLQAIDAASDQGITQGIANATINDLRQDARRAQELGEELRALVILIAGKAESLP